MYGKAGAYRLKSFGVEYRTLSNFWIFDERNIQWVYDGVQAAVDLVNTEMIYKLEDLAFGDTVQNAINSNSRTKANALLIKINNVIKKETICVDY